MTSRVPLSLDSLFSEAEFEEHVRSGMVRVRRHPSEPLAIANYTSRAAFERVWNQVTTLCRGLIWDTETGEVVARPFAKFFDLHETSQRPPARPPVTTEKLDGSLGVLYRRRGRWSVATRGSFDSEQAAWANSHLERYYSNLEVPDGVTPLVEILYPENRIVVDHGRKDLVLIAAIQIETGADVPLWEIDWWPGPQALQFVVDSAHSAYLLATSDSFAEQEGLVLTWFRPDRASFRVKVKHPRYVELHRIVTGLTQRDLWRIIVIGDWLEMEGAVEVARVLGISRQSAETTPGLDDLLPILPPDLRDAVGMVVAGLRDRYTALLTAVEELWSDRPVGERREFATWAATTPYRNLMFARLDHKPWALKSWSYLEPDPVRVASLLARQGRPGSEERFD